MSHNTYIFSPQRSALFIWILYAIFILNDTIFKRKHWEIALWDWIKCELFFIGGACQHSGNCCQKLMLIRKGTLIKTLDLFNAHLKDNPHYDRFKPKLEADEQTIHSFSCSCLTTENLCSDYENRPKICHNYPVSVFIQEDHILDNCGFKIQKKHPFPTFKNKRLNSYIGKVLKLNKLS